MTVQLKSIRVSARSDVIGSGQDTRARLAAVSRGDRDPAGPVTRTGHRPARGSLRARVSGLAVALGLMLPGLVPSSPAAASGLTYVAHQPADKVAHPPLVVLLHGSGADERDMIGLWPRLPGDFVVVSPRGPFADAAGGFCWYGRVTAGRAPDMEVSRRIVDTLVEDATRRFDADPKRIFVAGFSQGGVMAYDLALREPGRFRGAAILSGSLFAGDRGLFKGGVDRKQDAFFIAHGTADDRIPLASATAARAELGRLGVPIAFHAYPGMRHEIGDAETSDLGRWLSERSVPVSPASP